MADNDGMQGGLKITSKSGTILYDSSWIAGVDYESYDVENQNEDDHLEE
jgi:hypothetical protein